MAADMRLVTPGITAAPLHGQVATRLLESRACAEAGHFALMRRAGIDAARLWRACWPHARSVWLACGPGNNGGDGLVMARCLHQQGVKVLITLVDNGLSGPADAQQARDEALAAGVPVGPPPWPGTVDVVVDALLGLGQNRAPAGDMAALVAALNTSRAPVLALDMPTGLDADSGRALGDSVVRATVTLSMLTLKPGLFTGDGRDLAGDVWWTSLGVDLDAVKPTARLLGADDAQALPARPHASHKGQFGDLWVLGGAAGMQGAALLAARAALAAGAGRVYLASLADGAGPCPPAALMSRDPLALQAPERLARATVVAGCGGGTAIAPEMPALLRHAARLVLDADALNAVAADSALSAALAARGRASRPTILTPHPLEAARLLGSTAGAVQSDRLAAARRLSERFGSLVVLKGSGSVIAAPGELAWVNATGNARLASAGTGDVLAGWLAGRWSALGDRPDAPMLAAREAVWRHGRAADLARGPVLAADALVDAMLSDVAR